MGHSGEQAAVPGGARLEAVSGPLKGKVFSLAVGELSIGRDPSNEISLLDSLGSRRHCIIRKEAEAFYAVHKARPFFGELVDFITSGDLVALVLEGPNAVKAARQVIGATDPVEADAGSIRGEFGTEVTFNLVHGSDSQESAEREIGIWFPEL